MARRATGPRPLRGESKLAFDALTIEGALLSPEWLARAAQLAADGQSEADYRVPKGLHLRDEIGRYWRIAQAHWADFNAGLDAVATAPHRAHALSERLIVDLLRESFGFVSLVATEPMEIDGRPFDIGHGALGGRVPLVVAPAGLGLDTLSPSFGDGGRRRSAFGLCQEFLNAEDNALWGLVSDGLTLRLLRDNASLTRPAWLQADLGRIFAEELYSDFAALWLLIHESRFGRPKQPVSESFLEAWRVAGIEEGTRAREHLRRGVEEALGALGEGFLSHPDNQALRSALVDGALTREAFFHELLRLAYRLIFLLTVEERGVLHPAGSSEDICALYAEGYSLRRLRERSVRRSAHDRFYDLWESIKIVFGGLAEGEPRLALPALAGLFSRDQCPFLDGARLENRSLLLGLFRLSWLRQKTGLERVNWRDMGPEELGSVYESLLELVPQISVTRRTFRFATGSQTKGNARKTSGSYYTPDSLVQVLLDSALEPVVTRTLAEHPEDPVEALLSLSVVDPACGSGHFLLGAARRLGGHVARLQVDGTPSASDYRHALRQVVGRCIYGVDLNPLAVELCKVSLWMEAVEPGLPLTFLDSHIQHGNALFGTTPDLMAEGIPDDAWKPIEGDDKKVARALKKLNRATAGGQRSLDTLWNPPAEHETQALLEAHAVLERASDEDLEALAHKEGQWQEILSSKVYRHQKLVADAWCAAFVWPKTGEMQTAAPTNDLWGMIRDGLGNPPRQTVETVWGLAEQYGFFHWHLAFPRVFNRGGFDVVLGNPPWEKVKLLEREFFASRDGKIASITNSSQRKKLIAKLRYEQPPVLWQEWVAASRQAQGESHFARHSARFPLCGRGDINTYALFAEHNRSVLESAGRSGFITPPGLATDDTTKAYFQELISQAALVSLYEFENEEFLFREIDHRVRFIVIVVAGGEGGVGNADLAFGNRNVAALSNSSVHFSLAPADFIALNPNTRTCPTFRSRRDADLNLAIYLRVGVLWRENDTQGNPWGLSFMAMLHMSNDSNLFCTGPDLETEGYRLEGNQYVSEDRQMLPLVEAKMVHHFDHRFGTYEGQTQAQANQGKLPEPEDSVHADPGRLTLPRYWVDRAEIEKRLEGRWERGWLLGWRDIGRSTDQRTVIASLFPSGAVGNKIPLLLASCAPIFAASLYANLCSFVLDYAARQKVSGTTLNYFIVKQLPVLPISVFKRETPWMLQTLLRNWLLPRVLELTYTAWDLQPFAQDVGYDGPPFRWDPDRRFLLRAELDAAFLHLYGISQEDTDYILETFPIVRKNDEKAHGEYRTKRVILEIYDAMAEASRTGEPYKTRLDPPPADPRVAHPPRPGASEDAS